MLVAALLLFGHDDSSSCCSCIVVSDHRHSLASTQAPVSKWVGGRKTRAKYVPYKYVR